MEFIALCVLLYFFIQLFVFVFFGSLRNAIKKELNICCSNSLLIHTSFSVRSAENIRP